MIRRSLSLSVRPISRNLRVVLRIGVLGCVLFAMSGGFASAQAQGIPKGENPNTPQTPEIDAGSAAAALTMLSGGLLLITDRFRRNRSSR